MDLSIDYQKLLYSKSQKVFLKRIIVSSALTLTLLPLFSKNLLNSNAKTVLSLSGLLMTLCCFKLPNHEYEDKLIDTYEKTCLKEYKLILQSEILEKQTQLEISQQQRLAETVERLPDHQIDYFAQKYGVTPILSQYYIENNEPVQTESKPVVEIPITESIVSRVVEKASVEDNKIFEWMIKALTQSTFLAGKKRSGKTYFMKWLLAGFIESMSDKDTFFISDPHYDNVDFDDPWINPEADKKLLNNGRLVKGEKTTLKMLDDVLSALEVRKAQGLTLKKGVGRIRIFMDEVDSYSDDAQEIISSAVKTIEYEAAKYGITVVLGVHSIKKAEMGIDSSVIDSMLQILFGGIVLDSNSVLSGAYPSMPARKAAIDKYRRSTQATRIVYVKDDTEVFVSHIPNLELPYFTGIKNDTKPKFNTLEEVIEFLTNWCFKEKPSKDQIVSKWIEITGKELNEQGCTELLNLLAKNGYTAK